MGEILTKELREAAEQLLKSVTIKSPDPLSDVNLFSILGMENKEVTAHSAFLYYILKPFVGQNKKPDDRHLRLFLNYLKETQIQKTRTSSIPEDPVHVDIYREYVTDEGRLDFLIVFDQDAAVVELKIWAGEQTGQITRYREYLKKNGFTCDNVFFLTPTGWDSTTGQSISISLQEMAEKTGVFDRISDLRKENGDYVLILKQYSNLIKKLTEDGSMEDLIKLFKKPLDIQAVDKLNDARRVVLANLMEDLLWGIHGCISKGDILDLGGNYPVMHLYKDAECLQTEHIQNFYWSGKSSKPGLCYRVEDSWLEKLKPELRTLLQKEKNVKGKTGASDLYFFIAIEPDLFAGFSPRLQKSNVFDGGFIDKEDMDVLKNVCTGINCTNWYWDWEWVYFNNKRVYFADYQNGILQLLNKRIEDKMEFDPEAIREIGNAIIAICRNQCKRFFDMEGV